MNTICACQLVPVAFSTTSFAEPLPFFVQLYEGKPAIVDTTPFRDWLNAKGLLFKPTTGMANDNNLRVRENPNLEAEIFGVLSKGDAVEVLDRTGIQDTIGDKTAYWYKVRRKSDGLEGWAFGGFIDVFGCHLIYGFGNTARARTQIVCFYALTL